MMKTIWALPVEIEIQEGQQLPKYFDAEGIVFLPVVGDYTFSLRLPTLEEFNKYVRPKLQLTKFGYSVQFHGSTAILERQ